MTRKKVYRPRNWSDYNKNLIQRGNITLWIHEDVLKGWYEKLKTGRRGASNIYSDLAIQCAAQVRFLYKLPLRATQGFLISLFNALHLTQAIPCYTTVSRRLKNINVKIPVTPSRAPRHLVLDSTGLKVYGEGEWKVRTHGYTKRRTWRKIHLGFDGLTQEIVCATLTTNDFKDSEVFEDCLSQLPANTVNFIGADGAYDSEKCYRYCHKHLIEPIIPPRRGAKIKRHGNCKKIVHARDRTLRYIRQYGRKKWKIDNHYHKRSLAETGMYRFKTIFSDRLSSRVFETQAQEVFIKCGILNRFTKLGLPQSQAA